MYVHTKKGPDRGNINPLTYYLMIRREKQFDLNKNKKYCPFGPLYNNQLGCPKK